jgi:hypothetical protein
MSHRTWSHNFTFKTWSLVYKKNSKQVKVCFCMCALEEFSECGSHLIIVEFSNVLLNFNFWFVLRLVLICLSWCCCPYAQWCLGYSSQHSYFLLLTFHRLLPPRKEPAYREQEFCTAYPFFRYVRVYPKNKWEPVMRVTLWIRLLDTKVQ